MTPDQAKKLLGWSQESEHIKFGSNYLLLDEYGEKVRCYNNVTNRPLYPNIYKTLRQEHLRKKWQMNGEPVIIGRTGLILNDPHLPDTSSPGA